jgi:signal transduction histidine kinase
MQNDTMSEYGKALAIMAHDLKAPLSAIVSILSVINKGYVTDMAKAKELVARASKKAEALIAMVNDILDYTLLTDKSMMKLERVDLYEVLNECVSTMKPYADELEITLSTCKELNEMVKGETIVNGNYTFLMRVFDNLIGNAIKYNKKNGKITIDCKRNTKKKAATISITDTGIGIPEEDMSKIFNIFERGKYARRNINGSLGLGLSLVRQIVEDHYGEIHVSSTVGVGTAVTVTLPLYKKDKEGGINES